MQYHRLYKSQILCKFIAAPCQILCGDGLYVVTLKLTKTRSHLVMQLMISYQENGYQENYGHQRQIIYAISQRQFLLQEEFCYRKLQQVGHSYDQQLYIEKSNLKQGVDCNFCSKLQKIFQVLKIKFKADSPGLFIVQLLFEKLEVKVYIFNVFPRFQVQL